MNGASASSGSLMEGGARDAEEMVGISSSALLAAIVESSDDAIISKSLDGTISSWNRAAERLFQYTAAEAIGRPITILIPEDRLHEEDEIISRIRRGIRIEHFETKRRRKDGSLVDISLSISPVLSGGRVIGASKIARDISAAKRAEQQNMLLLREMNHRVKNLFAVTTGLLSVSHHTARDMDDLVEVLRSRILALARAHDLTLPDLHGDATVQGRTSLFALLQAILAPYALPDDPRLEVTGVDLPLPPSAITSLALLLNEFATNAAKYGSLSLPGGRIGARVAVVDDTLALEWSELEGPPLPDDHATEGFGSLLERATIAGLEGEIERDWHATGMVIRLRIPLRNLAE